MGQTFRLQPASHLRSVEGTAHWNGRWVASPYACNPIRFGLLAQARGSCFWAGKEAAADWWAVRIPPGIETDVRILARVPSTPVSLPFIVDGRGLNDARLSTMSVPLFGMQSAWSVGEGFRKGSTADGCIGVEGLVDSRIPGLFGGPISSPIAMRGLCPFETTVAASVMVKLWLGGMVLSGSSAEPHRG